MLKPQNTDERNDERYKEMERHTMFIFGRLNVIKMSVLPTLICRFNAIPIQIPAIFFFFVDLGKFILKVIWKDKRIRRAKAIMKKYKVEGVTLPNFKTYYRL